MMRAPNSVVAIIPARGGSKGVPGKNLRRVGGVPLVCRSVAAAVHAESIGAVYVSSDDEDILRAGEAFGAHSIRRPETLSGDQASSEAALLHAIEHIERSVGRPEIVVFLQCTAPFTHSDDVDAVVASLDDPNMNSALSASTDHGFLWRIDANGAGGGVNHDESKPRQRRQDMEPQFRENGAIYAFRTSVFLESQTRFCPPIAVVETSSAPLEIDTPKDLKLCQLMASAFPSVGGIDERLSNIKLLVTDFDGVHTDDRVLVMEDGTEGVMCSRADGMGVERLRKAGLRVVIVSKETNRVVAARAAKLGVEVFHGQEDKATLVGQLLAEADLAWEQLAFIGNDINDVACMERAGLAIAPADARPVARGIAQWVTEASGGAGAVREVCDRISLRGRGNARGDFVSDDGA